MENTEYIGLAKTLYNSSVCKIIQSKSAIHPTIYLSERIEQIKNCGSWPKRALLESIDHSINTISHIIENRDVTSPLRYEKILNNHLPFIQMLEKNNLLKYSSLTNSNIKFLSHHLAHAFSALFHSPFQRSIILVVDGAGSSLKDVHDEDEKSLNLFQNKITYNKDYEEVSAYIQDGYTVTPIYKRWQTFEPSQCNNHFYSSGIGTSYELVSKFIFNDNLSAGKVMGLAAFGTPSLITDRLKFLKQLQWSQSFQGSTKKEWEKSSEHHYYKSLAASIQLNLEQDYIQVVTQLKEKYPNINNLILVGGCALNCKNNMNLVDSKIFKNVFIPPFPGDEGISLGLAYSSFLKNRKDKKSPLQVNHSPFLGSKKSIPSKYDINNCFSDFNVVYPDNIISYTSKLLSERKIIGWFQGRSESGKRALGARSILSRIDNYNLKNYLNNVLKQRESFRPYGASVAKENAHNYFDVPLDFNNPYMSFSCGIISTQLSFLKEVSHIDNTCRMQTVCSKENPLFHKLLTTFSKMTGHPILLNTSLNIMGEPIVENILDLKNFLISTDIYGITIGDCFVFKN